MNIKITQSDETAWNERLTEARKKSGMSQEELGNLVGVGQGAASRWERGEVFPSVANLVEIAAHLDVGLDWLFDPGRTETLEEEREIRRMLRRVGPRAINRLMGLPDSDPIPPPSSSPVVLSMRDETELDRDLVRQTRGQNKRSNGNDSKVSPKGKRSLDPGGSGRPDQGKLDQSSASKPEDHGFPHKKR
jgi:transcriptional regulator with XRE-family HTH domain